MTFVYQSFATYTDEEDLINPSSPSTHFLKERNDMAKPSDNFADNLKDYVMRSLYRGPDTEIPSLIYDTVDILYKGADMKPFIFKRTLLASDAVVEVKKHLPTLSEIKNINAQKIVHRITVKPKKKQTWCLVVNLPPGCDYDEFKGRTPYFSTAIGGSCLIEAIGKAVYMTVSNIPLPDLYTYEFDPIHYLKHPNKKKRMIIPVYLGKTVNGPIVEDFAKLVSLFVAGVRDSGKSVLAHGAIYDCLSIDKAMGGNYIQVCIIDPKMKEFRYFEEYGATWTHEPEENLQLLQSLEDENRRRKNILGTKANNILEYNSISKNPLPYIMLFVDEVDMVGVDMKCAKILIASVQKYRSQGIYVWASTQRPGAKSWGKGDMFSEFKSQFEARVCYRMSDSVNSRMVLESDSAAKLPKIPGRAIYKYDQEVEIQTPYFPSRIRDQKAFSQLMDQLPQVALPYTDIQGEVEDYEEFRPRPRQAKRSESVIASRSLKALISGANTST